MAWELTYEDPDHGSPFVVLSYDQGGRPRRLQNDCGEWFVHTWEENCKAMGLTEASPQHLEDEEQRAIARNLKWLAAEAEQEAAEQAKADARMDNWARRNGIPIPKPARAPARPAAAKPPARPAPRRPRKAAAGD